MKRTGTPLLRVAMVAMLAATAALVPVAGRAWRHTSRATSSTTPAAKEASPAWTVLDPQQRCDRALALVTVADPWRTTCRWREPADQLQGSAFPPPKGEPPFDDPHIEIYVDMAQTRESVAHAIAHEMGHMRHTRAPTFVPEWLAARGLPADTSPAVWAEDYAETFAALFGPSDNTWQAPTRRPDVDELTRLKERFFS